MPITNPKVINNHYSFLYLTLVILIAFGSNEAIAKISRGNWGYVSNEVKETCNSVKNMSIPPQDIPSEIIKNSLKHCDSDELYFGFKNPPDYVKARNCAIVNHYYDVLTMIYANGKGVKANLDLAIHFACLFGGAGAEIEGRIKHLTKLKSDKNPKNFNICDDITSGDIINICTSYEQRASVEKQKKHLDLLNLSLTLEERTELKKCLSISSLYFDTRTANEMDRFGTGAQAFIMSEEMNLNSRMIQLLDKIIHCKLKSQTPEQFKKADNILNALYKKTQKKPDEEFYSITRDGIKKTERTWIRYKDAWVSFGLNECPKISKTSWETLITNDRIKQLEDFVRYDD